MYKLLIVEDEDSLSTVLTNKFNSEGFEVFVAKDGEEGLRLALEKHPDIILVDIILPRMDGLTMMEEIRKDSWGKHAKAIVLTNLQDDEKAQEAKRQGVNDFLIKSDWKLEDVVEKVKNILSD
jgi:DNA-binding response OmpR family regulator